MVEDVGGTRIVTAAVFNPDIGRFEKVECRVSEDLYKIITSGMGLNFSIADYKKD